ncbi:hypothetical protein OH809_44465 (plasmid) [Streptomyces sp. NBC_00873]|uniref:hypothetical protein n=1 Tax=unclassified Streptomyces TaxID=2593676 RepID=UPI002F913E8D|nr:hypothetical protein OH809_44465 [Streptomyces sp. NBC_00873]WTA49284.1 hypothetical protein OH821_44175 [Streptomyces sp. NBC_00842]
MTEDGRHEGYAVAVLADGRDATAEDNPVSGNSAWWCFDGKDGKPLAVGVRAGCDCYAANGARVVKKWRGSTVYPVVFRDWEATEGPGEQGSPYAEWENVHVAPTEHATVPADITELLAGVRERLAALAEERPLAALTAVARLEAVTAAAGIAAAAAAQRRGSSWTDIGKAVGTTKQAAHQRFARHLKPAATVTDQAPGSDQVQRAEHLDQAEEGESGAARPEEQRGVEAEFQADRLGLLGAEEADEKHHQGRQGGDRDPRGTGRIGGSGEQEHGDPRGQAGALDEFSRVVENSMEKPRLLRLLAEEGEA